ncbi:hypothetical protein QO206_13140 [Leeuwenhoekiella aequorea]|uniref:hypothetical protein n=1 Tax=Leeuwenhoekiella aequorea TaxID=283736 RepID=UPI00352D74CD|tara:strand:+ start:2489 stop:2755 length:267 start_codon:yes stop_codon:yes gene_type:complete
MNTTITLRPKFDLLQSFHPESEHKLAYVWGWDTNGNTYYGLCPVMDGEVFGEPLTFITIPYRFNINNPFAQFCKDFVADFEKATLKSA